MTHLTEEDLILHFYGEYPDGEGASAHLAACSTCGPAYEALRTDLQAITFDAPARRHDYGARVWNELQPRLAAGGSSERVPAGRIAARTGAGLLAIAASILFAFLLGRHMPAPELPASGTTRERILLVALGDHLERSQMFLVELAHADPEESADVSGRAQQLVAANRLYRQTARQSGETGLVNVLEELERVLVEAANAPEPLSAGEVRALNERIEKQGLLFKVRVVGSRLRDHGAEATTSTSSSRS